MDSDLQPEIDEAAKSKAPVKLHDVIADESAKIILSAITDNANPIDTEKLVRWYIEESRSSKRIQAVKA